MYLTSLLLVATLAAFAVVANLLAGIRRAGAVPGGLRARLAILRLRPDLGLVSTGEKRTETYDEALTRMRDIQDEIDRLSKRDDLDDEDERRWAELVEEFEDLDKHRRKLAREQQRTKVKEAFDDPRVGRIERQAPTAATEDDGYDVDPMTEPGASEDIRRNRNPWDLSNLRTYGREPHVVAAEFRARALDAISRMRGANDKVRAAATDIVECWDDTDARIAQLALATSDPAYFRAFAKAAKAPGNPDHTPEERMAVERVRQIQRAMSLTDSAGGYLVPFQLDPTVIITANGSVNDIRQAARQVVATGDVWNGVSSSAVAWSWDAEGSQVSDDSPTLASPNVPVYTARGFVPISLEARQDAANVAQEVGRLLAFGKDVLEAGTFATGDGSGKPTGIITALTGGSSVVTSATTDTFALADVYALQGALPARFRKMAKWLGNNLIYNKVRQFDTSGGGGFWVNLNGDRPAQLLGRDVLEAEDMDGVINATQENYVLVFGDFSNYVIADRLGVTVDFIPHLFQQTTAGSGFGRPTGQSGWFAYYRAGADSVNDGAFRMLNVT